MKLLERLLSSALVADDLKNQLFAFLGGNAQEFPALGGQNLTRVQAADLLCELIPAEIQVRGICSLPVAAVAAAPHVSFDNWSEYFCNRIARRLHIGWVVAKNFRDQHAATIPVSIGRHIHVNRPTESDGPGRTEYESERARAVHEQYLTAIREASGRASLPVDLLAEFHSHHRTPDLEIATAGVNEELAADLFQFYNSLREKRPLLPAMKIAPLHELRLSADAARKSGSIRTEVARVALHIEIPLEMRQSESLRRLMLVSLRLTIDELLKQLQANPEIA
ncbi:hypothetical protein EHM69_11295 [candidate division KSB1 bacterium]|nr:MAG: hypothetical protein EHM69_11295 [candidate division KSB1 bacterium]